MTTTICPKCNGLGFIPSRGYRFYSQNGRLCSCGMFKTMAECVQFAEDLRVWCDAVHRAEVDARRQAERAARRARRAAEAEGV